MTSRRKKVVLTLEQKLALCEESKSVSPTVIMTKYNIGRSTFYGILKQENTLRSFTDAASGCSGSLATKSMKKSDYPELDQALFIWMRQMREKNIAISGSMLRAQSLLFFPRLYPSSTGSFNASSGFIWRFNEADDTFCRR